MCLNGCRHEGASRGASVPSAPKSDGVAIRGDVILPAVYSLYLLLVLLVTLRLSHQWLLGRTMSLKKVVQRALLTMVAGASLILGAPVDGLEYEDAYIHKSSARYQLFHAKEPTDRFYVMTCILGSMSDCQISASFGTHLVGPSALISGMSRLVGWSARLGNVLSGLCWIVMVHCTWSLLKARVAHPMARALGIGLLLSSPAMYVIGGSALAEPLFGVLMMLCVWQVLNRPDEADGLWMLRVGWGLWFVSLVLLALSKKEGLLFIGLVSAWDLLRWWRQPRDDQRRARSFTWASISVAGLVVSVGIFRPLEALARHSGDIGISALDVRFISRLTLPLLSAAISPMYFGMTWIAFGVSLVLLWRYADYSIALLSSVVIGYLVLYAMHARHYQFVLGGDVQVAEMVRYLYAITPLTCLVTASLVSMWLTVLGGDRRFWHARMMSWGVLLLIAVSVTVAGAEAMSMKRDMAREEEVTWRNSLERVVLRRNQGKIFVSSRTAALYAYADDDVKFVDFIGLSDPRVLGVLNQFGSESRVVVLDGGLCISKVVRGHARGHTAPSSSR